MMTSSSTGANGEQQPVIGTNTARNWLLAAFKVTAIFFMVQGTGFAASKINAWVPSASLISEVESRLSMPAKSSPLKVYIRYYTGTVTRKGRVLVGTFVRDDEHAGIRVVGADGMPRVLDAGCAIINLTYDVKRRKVLSLFCNGVA